MTTAPGWAGSEPLKLDLADVSWLEEALSLEDQIWAHARRTRKGEVSWLAPAAGAGQTDRLGPHLYDGVTGVALFLAALEHATGLSERREHVLRCLAPLRRDLERPVADPDSARGIRISLGGVAGLGAYIYGLLLIGRWLNVPELFGEAAGIATLITPERIAADDSLDVMSGCAGGLLGLLALDRVVPDAREGLTPLDRALACGEHLLRRRVSLDGQPRAWPALGRPPMCGFAHGATGISYALARLFERTAEPSFRDAAAEGVAFERLHYDSACGNWRFLGSPGPAFFTGWCHGAPGIALGRVGLLHLLDTPETREEIRAALKTTARCPVGGRDFACCGNMGRADVLLCAHETLGGERLLAAANRIAGHVVSRSRENGGRYRWFAAGDDRFAPSFFRGAAGVGYTLLRLARPALLPCVLALEWLD